MCLRKLFHSEIQDLAYKFYKEGRKGHGHDLEDWYRAENIILRRFLLGLIYSVFGILLVMPLAMCFLYIYWVQIIWCIGWSMMGAGVGLINTRNQPQDRWLHLLGYWGFIIVAVALISFTISLYKSGDIYPCLGIKFYSLSATIGLIGGFLGYTFHELIRKILVSFGILGK